MYEPQVDDYVKWTTALGMVHEGWVYFKCEPAVKKKGWAKPEHYITIELGVRAVSYTHLTLPTSSWV